MWFSKAESFLNRSSNISHIFEVILRFFVRVWPWHVSSKRGRSKWFEVHFLWHIHTTHKSHPKFLFSIMYFEKLAKFIGAFRNQWTQFRFLSKTLCYCWRLSAEFLCCKSLCLWVYQALQNICHKLYIDVSRYGRLCVVLDCVLFGKTCGIHCIPSFHHVF